MSETAEDARVAARNIEIYDAIEWAMREAQKVADDDYANLANISAAARRRIHSALTAAHAEPVREPDGWISESGWRHWRDAGYAATAAPILSPKRGGLLDVPVWIGRAPTPTEFDPDA